MVLPTGFCQQTSKSKIKYEKNKTEINAKPHQRRSDDLECREEQNGNSARRSCCKCAPQPKKHIQNGRIRLPGSGTPAIALFENDLTGHEGTTLQFMPDWFNPPGGSAYVPPGVENAPCRHFRLTAPKTVVCGPTAVTGRPSRHPWKSGPGPSGGHIPIRCGASGRHRHLRSRILLSRTKGFTEPSCLRPIFC